MIAAISFTLMESIVIAVGAVIAVAFITVVWKGE